MSEAEIKNIGGQEFIFRDISPESGDSRIEVVPLYPGFIPVRVLREKAWEASMSGIQDQQSDLGGQ